MTDWSVEWWYCRWPRVTWTWLQKTWRWVRATSYKTNTDGGDSFMWTIALPQASNTSACEIPLCWSSRSMLVPSSNRISVPSRLVASRLRTVIVVGSDISVSELKFTVADRPTDAACDEWTCSRAGRNYSAATAAADAAATAILALVGWLRRGAETHPAHRRRVRRCRQW